MLVYIKTLCSPVFPTITTHLHTVTLARLFPGFKWTSSHQNHPHVETLASSHYSKQERKYNKIIWTHLHIKPRSCFSFKLGFWSTSFHCWMCFPSFIGLLKNSNMEVFFPCFHLNLHEFSTGWENVSNEMKDWLWTKTNMFLLFKTDRWSKRFGENTFRRGEWISRWLKKVRWTLTVHLMTLVQVSLKSVSVSMSAACLSSHALPLKCLTPPKNKFDTVATQKVVPSVPSCSLFSTTTKCCQLKNDACQGHLTREISC